MIPGRLLPETVTIKRAATTTDRYGNVVKDWQNATSTTSKAWIERVVSQRSSENEDERESLSANWLLIVPPNTDITGRDRVEWNSTTYEVDGPPAPRRRPSGVHHIEASLRWVEG